MVNGDRLKITVRRPGEIEKLFDDSADSVDFGFGSMYKFLFVRLGDLYIEPKQIGRAHV
jgi:hypothetical protein